MAAKIENVQVYGLAETIFRSGYPLRKSPPTKSEFHTETALIEEAIKDSSKSSPEAQSHIKRAISLANAKGGGHNQFLTGIIVNFDLTLSNKAWVEAERYRFLNFISSMSTMHRVAYFPIADSCNEHTDVNAIKAAEELQKKYWEVKGTEDEKEAYLNILYNLPSGFEIMAGMTTNYRCLRNIYEQRRSHKLPDWQVFCDWIETLPLAQELILPKM